MSKFGPIENYAFSACSDDVIALTRHVPNLSLATSPRLSLFSQPTKIEWFCFPQRRDVQCLVEPLIERFVDEPLPTTDSNSNELHDEGEQAEEKTQLQHAHVDGQTTTTETTTETTKAKTTTAKASRMMMSEESPIVGRTFTDVSSASGVSGASDASDSFDASEPSLSLSSGLLPAAVTTVATPYGVGALLELRPSLPATVGGGAAAAADADAGNNAAIGCAGAGVASVQFTFGVGYFPGYMATPFGCGRVLSLRSYDDAHDDTHDDTDDDTCEAGEGSKAADKGSEAVEAVEAVDEGGEAGPASFLDDWGESSEEEIPMIDQGAGIGGAGGGGGEGTEAKEKEKGKGKEIHIRGHIVTVKLSYGVASVFVREGAADNAGTAGTAGTAGQVERGNEMEETAPFDPSFESSFADFYGISIGGEGGGDDADRGTVDGVDMVGAVEAVEAVDSLRGETEADRGETGVQSSFADFYGISDSSPCESPRGSRVASSPSSSFLPLPLAVPALTSTSSSSSSSASATTRRRRRRVVKEEDYDGSSPKRPCMSTFILDQGDGLPIYGVSFTLKILKYIAR